MNKLFTLALLAGIAGSTSLVAAEAGKGHDVPRVVNAEEKNNEDSKSNEMENKESKENDKSTERKK
jgi:hypothetical protein